MIQKRRMLTRPKLSLSFVTLILFWGRPLPAIPPVDDRFQTIVLSEEFHSEGIAVADIDGDEINDIVSGPSWYPGPDFRNRIAYAPEKNHSIEAYSDHFFSFTHDFNGDGHLDILSIPIPGGQGVWFENPGNHSASNVADQSRQNSESPFSDSRRWKKHLALESVDGESPLFTDITSDGQPELVCIHQGNFGYATFDSAQPGEPWKFIAISTDRHLGRFTHGLGVGDVDGDGRMDLLETNGWWQQTDVAGEPFVFHAERFAQAGGSQMFAYDFDGDGDNDLVSTQNAHAYGLSWFERRGNPKENFLFVEHKIMTEDFADNPYGLALSQMHAMALADIDGDGVKDIVTGKRFYAHGGRDPGAQESPVLLWLRTNRTRFGVDFVPHVIHLRSGVGTDVVARDVNRNGHVDILVGNKMGTFLHLNSGHPGTPLKLQTEPTSKIGTSVFAEHVRQTKALLPEQERNTFVLPEGFEIQLVASEPDIAKPLNMAMDAKGRLWVTSSVEYPYPATDHTPRDTIKILEDADGDGRAEKITTFADKLNIPMGLYPYKDGVICFSTPDVLFLRDTDGDGKADVREKLYGPFDTTRDTHGMVNGLTRGFDGWLYACHGFNNQSSVAGTDGHQITMNSGNTFRMRLDGSRIEIMSHGQVNPFGMAFDPNGDVFTADCHTKPISILMRGGYHDSFGKPHNGVGYIPNVMEHLHGSTAIGGIALDYTGAFPDVFAGNSFHGNVMTGRVNRNSIAWNGSSVNAREEPDFLVSSDPWFRPVDLQFGPDGGLYIADFYNRIIGHYEVPLDHPGRDRTRGRIWKIVYTGGDHRRDALPKPPLAVSKPLRSASKSSAMNRVRTLEDAIKALSSPNLATRMLATHLLCDEFPIQSIEPMLELVENVESPREQIHAAWVLQRLGRLGQKTIRKLSRSPATEVRIHAFRLLEGLRGMSQSDEAQRDEEKAVELLLAGFSDSDAMVRRTAVMASIPNRSLPLVRPLMQLLAETSSDDVHLRHAIKLSLREHMLNGDWFERSTTGLSASELVEACQLCLMLKTDFAGEFLVEHFGALKLENKEALSEYFSFAARHASAEKVETIVAMAQDRFAGDRNFQEKLIRLVCDAIAQRGEEKPVVVRNWGVKLATARLDRVDTATVPIQWTSVPHPPNKASESPWVVSNRRVSADGQSNSKLFSSFPKGEQRTGVYRSAPFALPQRFQFYLAGHDGFPSSERQGKNFVRLKDAVTGHEVTKWAVPRNDIAQLMEFEPGSDTGRRVMLELVDGDDATAYAWLAAGRFSVAGLRPSKMIADWHSGAKLVADLRLSSLRPSLVKVIRNQSISQETTALFANALVAISSNNSSQLRAVAESFPIPGVSGELREELVETLVGEVSDLDRLENLISQVMSVADAKSQKRIADVLASDRVGVETLLQLVEAGRAAPDVLIVPSIASRLASITPTETRRIANLTASIAKHNTAIEAKLSEFVRSFGTLPADSLQGAKLFKERCAVCHQVDGVGNQVGPNLDGIGNRGLDRIVEDVFVPNRNLDIAFRASVILTDDGTVYSGLPKGERSAQFILVDQKGKEIAIPKNSIERETKTTVSPMPANFSETLTERQMSDLVAYLLALKH